MQEWGKLVQEKNALLRYEQELMIQYVVIIARLTGVRYSQALPLCKRCATGIPFNNDVVLLSGSDFLLLCVF